MPHHFQTTPAEPHAHRAAPFSPYTQAAKMGAVDHSSGINWSYATFNTKDECLSFEKVCNEHGYRTRNMSTCKDGKWSVQYHHHAD